MCAEQLQDVWIIVCNYSSYSMYVGKEKEMGCCCYYYNRRNLIFIHSGAILSSVKKIIKIIQFHVFFSLKEVSDDS